MERVVISQAMIEEGMNYFTEMYPDVQLIVENERETAKYIFDLQKADGFILRRGRIDRNIVKQCPRLKVISRTGVGVDNVDVQAATEQGIPVVFAPGGNTRSVVEHTLTLVLALAKNLVTSCSENKAGNFDSFHKASIIEIAGKTIGIVGFGNIGRAVASQCRLMKMSVLIYDPYVTEEALDDPAYVYCKNLEDLLKASDFITLHMPATPETNNLINERTLSMMKEGSFIINCARGTLVDEGALYKSLEQGHLAGAALDVLAKEPMDPKNPLFSLSNCLITPHIAGGAKEAALRSAIMAIDGTMAVIRGEKWKNVINPEVYQHSKWN